MEEADIGNGTDYSGLFHCQYIDYRSFFPFRRPFLQGEPAAFLGVIVGDGVYHSLYCSFLTGYNGEEKPFGGIYDFVA